MWVIESRWASRHGNKLWPGHLRGNCFRVLVRDADAAKAEPILARLREHGLPNYYGDQRFGRDGETVNLGMAMLKRERTPRVNRSRPVKLLTATPRLSCCRPSPGVTRSIMSDVTVNVQPRNLRGRNRRLPNIQ